MYGGAPSIRLTSSAEVVSLSPSIPGPLPPASFLPWQPSPPESRALGVATPWGVPKAGPPCLPRGVQFSPCPAPRQPVSLVGWRGPPHSPSPRQETRRPDLPRFLKNKRHVSSQHPGRTLPARLRSCQGQPPNHSPNSQCVFGGSERHRGPSERCFCSATAGVKCQLSPAHTMLLARALLVPNGDLQSGLEDRWKCRGTLIYGETGLVSAPWHHLCGAPCREAASSLLSEAAFLILCLFFLSPETGAGDRPVHRTTGRPVHLSLRVRGAPWWGCQFLSKASPSFVTARTRPNSSGRAWQRRPPNQAQLPGLLPRATEAPTRWGASQGSQEWALGHHDHP